MKRLIALFIICSGMIVLDGNAATTATRVSRAGAVQSTGRQSTQSSTGTARSQGTTNARAATVQRATGRSGVAGGQQTSGVAARAATTQKVINSGTKVAGVTTNTVVNEECKTKYYGCMDSFCMLDNTNGGRCLCSNRNAELDDILEEIQKLDEQSYAMATTGVERINMGDSVDAVQKMVDKASEDMNSKKSSGSKVRKLNLDDWDTAFVFEDIDAFDGVDDISNLKGDSLQAAVSTMCMQQIPECSKDLSILKMMYSQQIKSDCNAYENSLKQQKNASAKKLQTAQAALREAALEQYQNANKYDLGQCALRFKQCMQTTAGCGEDFSKCASVAASDRISKAQKVKSYNVKGAVSSITIAATTYDTLLAKKPLCETVTQQCVAVKDNVWDVFLKEAAPALKNAELIAESDLRMNCIANISDCFQKACRDTMDPNDPDGSYDMCLSRPQTMRSVCKVQIDPCEAAEPLIMDYVVARLASMRVDACTTEVKECLTDENRCGKDYTNCIGLDTDTIINLCPSEKLTACNTDENGNAIKNQTEVYEKIDNIISGIMLNIDNSMLTQCQNALNEVMIKVCGDTETCDDVSVDFGLLNSEMHVGACKWKTIDGSETDCRSDIAQFDSQDINPFDYEIKWNEGNKFVEKITKVRKSGIPMLGLAKIGDEANQSNANPDGYGIFATLIGRPADLSRIRFKNADIKTQAAEGADGETAQQSVLSRTRVNKNVDIETQAAEGADGETAQQSVQSKSEFVCEKDKGDCDAGTQKIVDILNAAFERTVKAIKTDTKVDFCITGREVQGRGPNVIGRKDVARFPNLTDSVEDTVAQSLLLKLSEYDAKIDDMYADQMAAMENKIATELHKNYADTENIIDARNYEQCEQKNQPDTRRCEYDYYYVHPITGETTKGTKTSDGFCDRKGSVARKKVRELTDKRATYDASTNVCRVETVKYSCQNYKNRYCKEWDDGVVISTQEIQMSSAE